MRSFLTLILLSAGCMVGEPGDPTGGGGGGGGGGGTSNTGSNTATPDGGTSTSTVACTGAAYDPCTDNTQCMSGKCQLFSQSGFQVCTTTCTPGDPTTCPMQNGQAQQCNNMGICKPAAANTCTR
jgi:hypothetical protein